jgi:RHS repeat-associated protein
MTRSSYSYDCSSLDASSAYKFTGKERDSESGLDNFGARYNSSQYGRFMTPDWSGKPQGVPYAQLDDPQSLDLYAYVENNPIGRADADGHSDCSQLGGCPPADDTFWFDRQKANRRVNPKNVGMVQGPNCICKGTGFWSRLGQHLGNLLNGHSWNYDNATVTVSQTFKIVGGKREAVTGVADGAGAVAAAAGGKVGQAGGAALEFSGGRPSRF